MTSFPVLLSNDWPMKLNNSFTPLPFKADIYLICALIDFAYSSDSLFETASVSYKSLLFPTIKGIKFFCPIASITSLYNGFKLLKEA